MSDVNEMKQIHRKVLGLLRTTLKDLENPEKCSVGLEGVKELIDEINNSCAVA